jgi:hypothetical protein
VAGARRPVEKGRGTVALPTFAVCLCMGLGPSRHNTMVLVHIVVVVVHVYMFTLCMCERESPSPAVGRHRSMGRSWESVKWLAMEGRVQVQSPPPVRLVP